MATDTDSVADHMTRLRMKMVQQKIQNEKDRLVNRPPSEESNSNDLEQQARLQQAMLRRQELLDKIRREQLLNEEGKRPRTYSARRRYTPSPLPAPPSRRSLPDFARYNYFYNQPDTNRSQKQDMSQVKHVIEHRIASPSRQYNLPPIRQFPANPPPIIIPPPAPHIMQHPAPQYIQAPPQHIIQQVPSPVIQHLGPEPHKSMFNKADQIDSLMLQNAQLHQLVLQRLVLDYRPLECPQCGFHRNRLQSGVPRIAAPAGNVHHHHYTTPPPSQPAVHHYTTLPAMGIRGGYPMQEATVVKQEPKTPEAVPRQVIPVPIRMPKKVAQAPPIYVQQPPPPRPIPVPIIIRRPRPIQYQIVKERTPLRPKKTVNGKTETLPRKGFAWGFWRVGMAALFVMHLKSLKRRPQNSSNRPSSMFLFGIILKEIVAALHRIYLNPNGNIYPVLNDIIGPNCYDLAELIHGGRGMGAKDESVLIQELQYVIENVIYHITEIMPTTGVLGTHRKSAVFELIRSGKRFPDGYFWQVEMDRLQLTDQGRTVNVGDSEGFMLMLGIFISRSLVTTILMKPMDYGLSNTPLSDIAERNLRIVATALLYLIRRISISRGRGIMDMPSEIAEYLYTDEEMDYIYGKLSRTFNYCEGLLREWGTEYIRRLRASSMQS
ncbi:uncharacterized protein LOC127859393 isoform X2 [Dreissena polymorpha]|uniref:uncharacterized protein LOC127859393 isoform X2 n=1 Tax=Dreissena polymorpha TaxID=45954 RepID=UPI0022653209|nr:uncharacterized protein LOC127859393 isoform X2 [Dreissena polymorpha]